jgi:hypothetical protein
MSSDYNSWDQAPVVLVSGPGKMLDLGVPKCSLSAEQVDRLEAASPEDFQGETD